MTITTKAAILLCAIALVMLGFLCRYEIQQPPDRAYVVRLNRWTGEVCAVFPLSAQDAQVTEPERCAR